MAVIKTGAIFKTLRFDGTQLGMGGVLSSDYGVYITGEAVFNAPTRRVNMIQIPGRNGLFAQDEGSFDNLTVTYPAGLFGVTESDFADAISNFRNALCSRVGYKRLEDDDNPSEFRMAVYKEGLEVTPATLKAGEFTISFECKPQRWLKSGDSFETVALYQAFDNPTLFDASPVIAVQGYGTIQLRQSDYVTKDITVAQKAGESRIVYIDCETGFAYYQNPGGKESAMDRVTLPLDLPKLTVGGHNQFLTIPNTVTNLAMQPRWWKI